MRRRSLEPNILSSNLSPPIRMYSPLARLAGAAANFSKSRVDLNETTERPLPKLLARDIYEVERLSQRGPPFSLSDLVGLSVVIWDA